MIVNEFNKNVDLKQELFRHQERFFTILNLKKYKEVLLDLLQVFGEKGERLSF
jgi:hypothetical protein